MFVAAAVISILMIGGVARRQLVQAFQSMSKSLTSSSPQRSAAQPAQERTKFLLIFAVHVHLRV
jgi:hypothetical protein